MTKLFFQNKWILILIVLLSMLVVPVTAGTIYADTDGKAVRLGDTLTVPVNLTNAENMGGFKLYVYNNVPGVTITINSSLPLPDASGDAYAINSEETRMYQVVSWSTSELTGLSGELTLFSIDVHPEDTTNLTIPISFETVEILSANGNDVIDVSDKYQAIPGIINISTIDLIKDTVASKEWNAVTNAEIVYELHPYHISLISAPTITNGNKPASLSLTLTDVSVTKLVNGAWLDVAAEVNEGGSVILKETITDSSRIQVAFLGRKLGDVNGDGKVKSGDKVKIGQYVAEIISLNETDFFYADITGDGAVRSGDKVKIGQYIAERIGPDYQV